MNLTPGGQRGSDQGLAARAAPWLLGAGFLTLLFMQQRRPLRHQKRSMLARLLINLAIGAGGALAVAIVENPLTSRLAARVERERLGLVHSLNLPPALARTNALLLLDYTLYLWHLLLHRVPALWRWHRVHHADRDLDVSTALRFHAVEMLWSVPWRLAQVRLIGVTAPTLRLWGRLTLGEVMFHHANLRLPARIDRRLGHWLATPSLHGIHHSDVASDQRHNLSSGLSVWDRLHGTYCDDVAQDALVIGLPAERTDRFSAPDRRSRDPVVRDRAGRAPG